MPPVWQCPWTGACPKPLGEKRSCGEDHGGREWEVEQGTKHHQTNQTSINFQSSKHAKVPGTDMMRNHFIFLPIHTVLFIAGKHAFMSKENRPGHSLQMLQMPEQEASINRYKQTMGSLCDAHFLVTSISCLGTSKTCEAMFFQM